MVPQPSAAELTPRRFSERVALLPDSRRDRNVVLSDEPEGAGHGHVPDAGIDLSGNRKVGDVGPFLKNRLLEHFRSRQIPPIVRYIDPSYLVRGGAANSFDGEYCLALGQHAVHAGMAGFTEVMIGHWNQRFTIVPIAAATGERRQLDPDGPVWQRLLQTTRQEC